MTASFLRKWLLGFLTILSVGSVASVAVQPLTDKNEGTLTDSLKKLEFPIKTYTTSRLVTEKPLIDGRLDDNCWKTGHWAGDFIQWIPHEGAPPSQPTEFKILYDDKNLYVAIRAYDSEPSKIHRRAGRRDQLQGDMVGVTFDSYHDHRTGFEFDVTAYGQKIDGILTNPMEIDLNWNAVWYAKVGMEDSAWVAEMEIPLSQLRYSNENEQVWGLHCWRWINRLQEESDWEYQSSTGPGILYMFGEMHGISGLKKTQRLELMPYAVGKLNTFEKQPDNPFYEDGYSPAGSLGLDAKLGISSNFTMDVTVNPDFGQVEADPSVMNLTAFETFYEEKRPFFLEGKNIFDYEIDDASLFYSRRIGQAPSYTPETAADEYSKQPEYTSIIDAVKVTGKTADGFSLGVLQSFTANEKALIADKDENLRKESVEPYTNYLVGRFQQDYRQGNSVLGGIFTSTNRFINDSHLLFMNRAAYTGGVDLLHQWKDKKYFVDAKLIGSYVAGDQQAMLDLQHAPARYYQRPDAGYLRVDSSLTHLTGSAGSINIGRKSKGLWRYSAGLIWYSPGLELNDLGYMQLADLIKQSLNISYFVNRPVSIFRTYSIEYDQDNFWDFGGRYLMSDFEIEASFEFLNKWGIEAHPGYETRLLDTRRLRGGEALIMPPAWRIFSMVKTDFTKRVAGDIDFFYSRSAEKAVQNIEIRPVVILRPVNTLKLVAGFGYSINSDQLQYIETINHSNQLRYILGTLSQETLSLIFRADFSITPEISLQYYGSPFVSKGKYTDYKRVTQPTAEIYADRFEIYANPVKSDGLIWLDENNDASPDYSIEDPDFNFLQFRSNLVARWEYRPGSQLYLVWSMDKTGNGVPVDAALGDSMSQIGEISPNNIFLIKFNYWFSI